MEFVHKMWRGEESLPFTYWLCYFLPGLAITILLYGLIASVFLLDPAVYDLLLYTLLGFAIVVTYGCGVAVIRSAGNRKPVGFWGGAACVVVVLGMIRLPVEFFVNPGDEQEVALQFDLMNAGLPQRVDEITTLNRVAYDRGQVTYSYYTLLRFVVCGFATYFAFTAHRLGDDRWARPIMAANLVLALLYNPFLPVHLGDKDVWTVVNLATVAAFTATVVVLRGRPVSGEERSNT